MIYLASTSESDVKINLLKLTAQQKKLYKDTKQKEFQFMVPPYSDN